MTHKIDDKRYKIMSDRIRAIEQEMNDLPLIRSPLNRHHQQMGANLKARNDQQVVARYDTPSKEQESARQLGLVDLSCLARIGFKGADTREWLAQFELSLPERPNQAALSGIESGVLVASLSDTEFLIMDSIARPAPVLNQTRTGWSMDNEPKTYLLERLHSHAWFSICGEHAAEMFSKLCAIDLRLHRFANLSVAQTSVARSNSIVIRCDQGNTPNFHLLFDLSLAEYMWNCLMDAMQEFEGRAIGHTAFSGLLSS